MTYRVASVVLILCAATGSAEARSFTGPQGGTGSVTIARKGTTGTASFSGTTANGRSASGSASATYHPTSGMVTGTDSMTGPAGSTHGGTLSAGNGSAMVTGDNGESHDGSRPK